MRKAWNKIERILIAYQKELADDWRLENKLPSFFVTKENNLNVIDVRRDIDFIDKIYPNEIFEKVISNNEYPYKIKFRVDVRDKKRKSILWIITNTAISLDQKKCLLNLFFKDEQLFKLTPFLRLIKKVKDSRQLDERKLIALHLLSIAKPKEYYSGGTLKSIVDELICYDYENKDLHIIESLFSIYKKEIKYNKNSMERVVFIDFLKRKINPNNWQYFKHLYEKDSVKKSVIEVIENKNAKIHLIFNISLIKEKYKFLSLENDLNITLEKISQYLMHFHYKFNLDELHILKNDDERFVFYLVSKNHQQVNKDLMVKVIYKLIEEYSKVEDLFESKTLIEKIIDCELLNLNLDDKNLKKNNITKI